MRGEPATVQALRRLPGGWALADACVAPERTQRSTLRALLAPNAGCQFLCDHGLSAHTTLPDYQARVPVRRYDELSPWLERTLAGERGVLTTDRPVMLALTTGSTAAPKHVPVTRDQARAWAAIQRLWLSAAERDVPAIGAGRIWLLTSPRHGAEPRGGLPVGSVTGLGFARDGTQGGRILTVADRVAAAPDYEERLYLSLLHALGQDLSLIVATSPSNLVLLLERLADWAEPLIADLEHGTIHRQQGSANLLPAPEPAVGRALELRRAVAAAGRLTPQAAWPRLALLGCWLAGPMARYRPRLEQLSGGLPARDTGYAASEGWFAVTLAADSTAALPLLPYYLVELLEVGPAGLPVPLEEAAAGARYRVVVTTPAGLYRYDTEDVVQVVGRLGRLPLVTFCERSGAISSVAGEKLTELQVIEAVKRLEQQCREVVRDFIAEAVWGPDAPPPHYRFRLALVGSEPAATHGAALAAALDRALCEVNVEYHDKRRSGRLGPVEIALHDPAELWQLQQAQSPAAPDGQRKAIHLRKKAISY